MAKDLIARGDQASARHACLELRLAIEYITYNQLQAYMSEVSDVALKKWTPKQVISEMLEVDPHADKSSIITFGLEHSYGVSPPPEEMQTLGQDRRFSMKWANKNHNALGNFLHAPTMHQLESGTVATTAAIIEKATSVATECDYILSSPVFNFNFGQFFEFECVDCGAHIRRRVGSFTQLQGVVCLSSSCRATYDIEPGMEDKIVVHLRMTNYTCQPCGAENLVGTHKVVDGALLECKKCGKKVTVVQRFGLVAEGNP
jgi:DNA-directed RNA polymerase subunit RPC12/RpoP